MAICSNAGTLTRRASFGWAISYDHDPKAEDRSTDPRVAADGAVAVTLLTVARRARMVEDAVMRIETACYLDGIERWLTQPAATSDGRS